MSKIDIINEINKGEVNLTKYRSGGFINKDYDMARITIDLPIIEAQKLFKKIKNK